VSVISSYFFTRPRSPSFWKWKYTSVDWLFVFVRVTKTFFLDKSIPCFRGTLSSLLFAALFMFRHFFGLLLSSSGVMLLLRGESIILWWMRYSISLSDALEVLLSKS